MSNFKCQCGHCSNDKWFLTEIIRESKLSPAITELRCFYCGFCIWI